MKCPDCLLDLQRLAFYCPGCHATLARIELRSGHLCIVTGAQKNGAVVHRFAATTRTNRGPSDEILDFDGDDLVRGGSLAGLVIAGPKPRPVLAIKLGEVLRRALKGDEELPVEIAG